MALRRAPRSLLLQHLDSSLLSNIFSFLPGAEVAGLCLVCARTNRVVQSSEPLWKFLFLRDYPSTEFPELSYLHDGITKLDRASSQPRNAALVGQVAGNLRLYQRAFAVSEARPRHWECLSASLKPRGPCARQGSAGCVLRVRASPGQEFLAVFGGWKAEPPAIDSDLWVAERAENQMTGQSGPTTSPRREWLWARVRLRGQRRHSTYGHSLTAVGDGGVVAFGGVTQGGYQGEVNTITYIDVAKEDTSWCGRCYVAHGGELTARAYHSATWVERDNSMVVFGGFDDSGAIGALEMFHVKVWLERCMHELCL